MPPDIRLDWRVVAEETAGELSELTPSDPSRARG
jgi:hypothetical protein